MTAARTNLRKNGFMLNLTRCMTQKRSLDRQEGSEGDVFIKGERVCSTIAGVEVPWRMIMRDQFTQCLRKGLWVRARSFVATSGLERRHACRSFMISWVW
jgi:hypothetical protein